MFSDSAELYDLIYAGFKDYAGECAEIAALLRRVHPACETVLDVACGTGEHARLLAANHHLRVDGVDLDPRLLEIARRKNPDAQFWEADMSAFDLRQRYDAVVCLFSSIGYLRTLDRVEAALRCFSRHIQANGVIVVEPWFSPGVLDPARVSRHTAEAEELRVERVSRTEIDGRMSRLYFDYRLEDAGGIRTASEVHELGLFTTDEMLGAFNRAGLDAEHDEHGLTGRGLFVASVRRHNQGAQTVLNPST